MRHCDNFSFKFEPVPDPRPNPTSGSLQVDALDIEAWYRIFVLVICINVAHLFV